MRWSIHIAEGDYNLLHRHLFPGDGDEHAAFLICGIAWSDVAGRLLVRNVVLVDNIDFGLSDRGGYRQIAARAVARAARAAGDEHLCIVWVHSHPGSGRGVAFSPQDHQTHEAAVPALSAITGGMPVGAVVFGQKSAAGMVTTIVDDIVLTETVDYVRVVGSTITDLTAGHADETVEVDGRFARQIHLFGEVGQQRLRQLTVAVVGVGGGGSLVVQMLAHLGVGTIIVVDFDVVEHSNLSRIVGSTATDADDRVKKVTVAERLVRSIDPTIDCITVDGDITYAGDAKSIFGTDFVFLATDTVLARWAFNQICHQYLIPGIQVGAKVTPHDTAIGTVHAVNRVLALQGGCLDCMGVIPADALADEQLTDLERKAQRYVDTDDDTDIEEASVISLNGIAASLAVTDFLLMVTGLHDHDLELDQLVYHPLERSLRHRGITRNAGCPTCDPTSSSSYARGDTWPLQLRAGHRFQAKARTASSRWKLIRRATRWLRIRVGGPTD